MPKAIEVELQIIFEEYRALKTEIQRRSQDQLTCLQRSLVSIGVLATVVRFEVQEFKILLLIAPWILLTLGSLWLDHHITIHDLAFYITKLEKRIKKLDSYYISTFIKNEWRWETFYGDVRQQRKQARFLCLPLVNLLFLQNYLSFFYFLIPSIISVISYFVILKQDINGWSLVINGWSLVLERWLLLFTETVSFQYWTALFIIILDCILTIYFLVFWWQANFVTDKLLSSSFKRRTDNNK